MKDEVNHPAHYNSGKIEVLEFIEDQKMNYSRGNILKYVARAGKKLPPGCGPNDALVYELTDLEKSEFYLRREIELLKARIANRKALRPNEMPKPVPIETLQFNPSKTFCNPDVP